MGRSMWDSPSDPVLQLIGGGAKHSLYNDAFRIICVRANRGLVKNLSRRARQTYPRRFT